MTNKNFSQALEMALNLPQDAATPIYQRFDCCSTSINVLYNNTIVDVFRSVAKRNRFYSKDGYFWEFNGTVKFHKKYSRKDMIVTGCSYDIVGLKRRSTHLPAGVLIDNVVFI